MAKRSKCEFGKSEVGYLGHLICGQRVKADLAKLKAMVEWPRPSSIKDLRGFLGLTKYYCRFIKDFGGIAGPLIDFPKKGGF